MSGATPAVSVVMAAYNGSALIAETLASLRDQTFADFEVIVVDDCSTDDTLAVLRAWPDPRVRVIAAAANGGPVRARNRAVAAARGRYVAGLDQDDLCRPERFARQVAWLERHPETVLLGTAHSVLDGGTIAPSTAHTPVTTPRVIEWLLHIENPLVWSTVMLRADAARTLDVFTRPELLYAEDFDLYHRMARLGGVARLDEDLLVYRKHAGGASQRFIATMAGSARRVLTDCYAPSLGDAAADAAELVVKHLMGGLATPDRATLARLGQVVTMLQEAFLADHACDAESLRLIRWETARRWARVGRTGLRAGTLAIADAVAVRPQHLGLGHAGIEELMWSRLLGRAKAARRYTARG